MKHAILLTAACCGGLHGQQLVELESLPPDADETRSVTAGDVDGDGDLDLVFVGTRPRLLRNEGDMRFIDVTATQLPASGGNMRLAHLFDADGDGDLDLLLGYNGPPASLWRNDGTGRFTVIAGALPSLATPAAAVASGDFDGDGDADLVVGGVTLSPRILTNDGTGRFATTTFLGGGSGSLRALVAFDADGDLDLDLAGAFDTDGIGGPGFVRFWRNNGGGAFAAPGSTPPMTGVCTTLAVGDVDGDRDLDLFIGRGTAIATTSPPACTTCRDLLWRNDGGSFVDVSAQLPADGLAATGSAFADVDGDADVDLILCHFPVCNFIASTCAEADTSWLENQGNGTFGPAVALPRLGGEPADHATALVADDLDGDRDVDVVVAATIGGFPANSGRDRVFWNLTRQAHAPAPAVHGQSLAIDFHARDLTLGLVLPALSLERAPTPLTIEPFGALWLQPTSILALPFGSVSGAAGQTRIVVAVPDNPALVGSRVHVQALLMELFGGGGARLTNLTSQTIAG